MEKNFEKSFDSNVKARISDIVMYLSWAVVARHYFNKSSSWLYHKFDGIDGNGGKGGFTPSEKEQLRGALVDLSDRLRLAADKI